MNFNSTEHPLSWFRDRYLDQSLVIKPPFQRKPVWAARQKCFLIESILQHLPVPEVYIQMMTTAEGRTTYGVVDGQQRIRSILQFVGAETDASEMDSNRFVLDKLPGGSRWANKTFAELSEAELRSFWSYRLSVRYLETDSDDEIRDMFMRLNRFLTPLNPQELRNAMFTGPFVNLSNRLANDEYWAENRIITPASIRRMGDIEFVSELLIGVLHGPQGGSGNIVDEYYRQYEDYEEMFPEQRRAAERFKNALSVVQAVIPDIKHTRWGNKTDFYTLFVAVASLLRVAKFVHGKARDMRKRLDAFAQDIETRLGNEKASVSDEAVRYVRAVEKGANDKKRRGDRHVVMLEIISPFFAKMKRVSA